MKESKFLTVLKEMFNLEKPSLLLLILPYIAISWSEIYNIGFFSWSKLVFLFLLFIFFDFIFRRIIISNKKNMVYITIFLVTILIFFFYGVILVIKTVTFLNAFLETKQLRARWLFLFYFMLIFFVQLLVIKKTKVLYTFLNFYFLTFFCVIFVSNAFQKQELPIKNIDKIKSNPITISAIDTVQKPIILIIADEYSSPDEIFKIKKDSAVYSFSNVLTKAGWITKNGFFSYETSTICSLSSLFNFNLSANKDYSKQSIVTIASQKLLKCTLSDSLLTKKVRIINYGIFDIGVSKPLTKLYNYPDNFIEQFFLYSCYFYFDFFKNDKLKIADIDKAIAPIVNHNLKVLDGINDTIKESKTFLYAHLYMPHGPYFYNTEFKFIFNNTVNYIEYWNFSNKKFYQTLKDLTKGNKYRIIITGDHGFRSDKRINPQNTFAAFWGFDKEPVDKLHSVQDLGSLINSYVFK